jgi:hypothetical protein
MCYFMVSFWSHFIENHTLLTGDKCYMSIMESYSRIIALVTDGAVIA